MTPIYGMCHTRQYMFYRHPKKILNAVQTLMKYAMSLAAALCIQGHINHDTALLTLLKHKLCCQYAIFTVKSNLMDWNYEAYRGLRQVGYGDQGLNYNF